jgi:uncharacterized damage-inducible protein DinB
MDGMLIDLIHYNNWANKEILAACEGLAEEQMRATVPGTYGSIRGTLAHLLGAEGSYIGRLTGQPIVPPASWGDRPSVAQFQAYAAEVGPALLETVQQVGPLEIVHEEENGLFVDYQARVLFIQVINHGIEHRTNITTILSSLGLPAPEVDGWAYTWAHGDAFGVVEGSLETAGDGERDAES